MTCTGGPDVALACRGGLAWLLVCAALLGRAQGLCAPPAVSLNSRVSLSSDDLTEDTVAKYICDPGFIRIGEATRTCTADNTWTGRPPTCVTNVAQGKPSSQSSTAHGGPASNGNDGDRTSLHDGGKCTETLNQTSPWWRVDLLQEYPVQLVRITTRGCCGQQPLQDVEIRIGSSQTLQQNRLCAWYPGTLEEGEERDFECARPVTGRYVHVQMVGITGTLSVCEVQVFTSREFAREQCAPNVPLERLSLYNQVCYELHLDEGTNYQAARDYCQRNSGDLVHTLPDTAFQYLVGQLKASKVKITPQLVWIGVRKVPGAQAWTWVNGETVTQPRWGKDQPNSYIGEQNCVVLDGGRDWLWNDFTCGIDYLHWICEYRPQKCGSPDRQQNTTMVGRDFSVNRTVQYVCAQGSRVVGDAVRTCTDSGLWSGAAPSCQHVNCGPLTEPVNGELRLLDDRTTYGARAQYNCEDQYALLGEPLRTCDADNKWSGDRPECLYSLCPEPATPDGGSLTLRGDLTAGGEAVFACSAGHVLAGEPVTTCRLGGTWSSPPPRCRLVDCGQLAAPRHGARRLAGGTLLGDVVVYSCGDDYLLAGWQERVCRPDGAWSGEQPSCELIECDEPDVPVASYVTGYGFHVHSEVEYHCNEGHIQVGDPLRVCQRDGTWSGEAPYCEYVNCGHTFALLHGNVEYVTGGTYLGSTVHYSCSRTYRLVGERERVCGEAGAWSGTAPICSEVRCGQPERPQNSVLNITGNDRMRQRAKQIVKNLPPIETFRVGTTVTYNCRLGHKVVGEAVRSCRNTGGWSGLPPTCEYVDCGRPEPPASGAVHLTSRATHYSAIAEYTCDSRFRLAGRQRRVCQRDAVWSGQVPQCAEVTCSEPERPADVLTVVTSGLREDDTARYNCGTGRRLVGDHTRQCRATGHWSGVAPSCQWVDCGPVPPVENGRLYLVNKTTVFDSLVEHNCFPGHERRGAFRRRCTETGSWSGNTTACVQSDSGAPVAPAGGSGPQQTADSATADQSASPDYQLEEARRTTAAWTGAAVAVFLLLAALAAAFCYRLRTETLKSAGNVHGMKPMGERTAPVAGFYSSPADVPNQGRALPLRPDEEDIYAEMDSFSSGPDSPPPSIYANRDATYVNGLHHSPENGDASGTYTNGSVGDSSATYTNASVDNPNASVGDPSATHTNGSVGDPNATYTNGSVGDPNATYTNGSVGDPNATHTNGSVGDPNATYTNGSVGDPNATYTNGSVGDPNATYTNGGVGSNGDGGAGDAAVTNVNGMRPGAVSPCGVARAPVSVNGMLVQ